MIGGAQGTRENIDLKIVKGTATKWERHWVECQKSGIGWIHPMKGKFPELFTSDYAKAEGVQIQRGPNKGFKQAQAVMNEMPEF